MIQIRSSTGGTCSNDDAVVAQTNSGANFLVSTCSSTLPLLLLVFLRSFLPRFTRDPLSLRKTRKEKNRERQKKWGSLSRKHVLPTIRPARRRFDEHYNIIRIGLALNEVGGARAKSDKGTNKKRPLLADHGGLCSTQALRRINSLPNREHVRSIISRMKERSTKSREPIAS